MKLISSIVLATAAMLLQSAVVSAQDLPPMLCKLK